jgi:hypothetical protein
MQNARDTFYVMLQGRLAALNPERTIVVRGLVRPGVLVDENELPTATVVVDAFRLQWNGLQVNSAGPMPLVALECEIRYATDGNVSNGGMDRGRLLGVMDSELATALAAMPRRVQKMDYAAAGPGVGGAALATNVWWGDVVFGTASAADERVERTAKVQVFAYQEAGEL